MLSCQNDCQASGCRHLAATHGPIWAPLTKLASPISLPCSSMTERKKKTTSHLTNCSPSPVFEPYHRSPQHIHIYHFASELEEKKQNCTIMSSLRNKVFCSLASSSSARDLASVCHPPTSSSPSRNHRRAHCRALRELAWRQKGWIYGSLHFSGQPDFYAGRNCRNSHHLA